MSIAELATAIALALSTLGETAGPPPDIGHLHALLISPAGDTLWIGAHVFRCTRYEGRELSGRKGRSGR